MCLRGVAVCLFSTLFLQISGQVCQRAVNVTINGAMQLYTKVECCSGYTGNYQASTGRFDCTPVCTPNCVNGFCTSPNNCSCNNEYMKHPSKPHLCVPRCSSDKYYETCYYTCPKPCHGPKCVEPWKCSCEPGWAINDIGVCIPTCSPECGNGICVDVNKCSCWNGYELMENASPQCVLKCDSGYERVDGVCKPHCSKPCQGGICSAPEECSCYRGWEMNEQGECIPICNPGCGNGTCVDLNVCVCRNGYELKEKANPRCVPSCRDCYGECVAPDKCRCKEPYTTIYLTDDNRCCDCLDDCDIICSRTTCLETTKLEQYYHHEVTKYKISSTGYLYTSVSLNIILMTVILIITCKNPGILQRSKASNRTETTSKAEGPFQYDYVQEPLPINQRYHEEVLHRR